MSNYINPFEKFLPSKTYIELSIANPIIPEGYIQLVEDIKDGKIGDGITPFNSLPFFRIRKEENNESNFLNEMIKEDNVDVYCE